MDYFAALIIISIIGGVVAVDTAAGWQIMICQPIVSCTFTGAILGQPEIGIILGILLQLPWLINIPSGGSHGSEGNIGAVVAVGLSSFFVSRNLNTDNIIIIVTIVYSLAISRIGFYLVDLIRNANVKLIHSADEAVKNANFKKIAQLNLSGLFYMFAMGFLFVGSGFALGIIILKPLIIFIHADFDRSFEMAKFGILGLGFGVAATLFFNKKTIWFILAGLAVSAMFLIIVYF